MALDGKMTLYDADDRPIERTDDLAIPHIFTFGSVMRSGWYTYNHLHDEAYRHNRRNAMAMRRDCFLMGLLRERKEGTLALKWHLEPDNPRDPWQSAVAAGLTKIIKGIHRFKRMRRHWLEALWYGRYGVQCKYAWRPMEIPVMERSGPAAPGVVSQPNLRKAKVLTVVKHKPVNGDKIGFHWDDTPYVLVNSPKAEEVRGRAEIIHTDAGAAAMLLRGGWRERVLIHTHDPDDADYWEAELAGGIHGVGIRSRIYWLDFMRREYVAWVTDTLERVGLGMVVIYYEAGNDTAKKEAMETAKKYSRKSALVLPRSADGHNSGGQVEIVEAPTAGAEIVLRLQEHVEEHIERYIVGQTMSGGADNDSGLGGTGRAEFAAETKQRIIHSDAEDVAESITGSDDEPGLVSVLLRWTYPWADFPVRFVHDEEHVDPNAKLDAIEKASSIGVTFPAAAVRALTGIPAPEPDEETVGGQPAPGGFGDPGEDPEDPATGGDQDEDLEGLFDGEDSGDEDDDPGGGDAFFRLETPELYDAKGGSGRWITIGAKAGADGKRTGGSPVYVENGRITKGHPRLTGRKIHALQEEPEEDSHRKQLNQSKHYARAQWGKKARAEGLDPKHLHQLAGDLLEHDREFKADLTKLLQEAREMSKGLGYGDLRTLKARSARGIDSDAVKGLDDVAQMLSRQFPEHFTGHEDNPEERLFNLLVEGNPEPLSEEDAYTQAFDHLMELQVQGSKSEVGGGWDDQVPFAYEFVPERYAFEESKHRRGQSDNAGQFGPGGSSNPSTSTQASAPKSKPSFAGRLAQWAKGAVAAGGKLEHAAADWVRERVAKLPHALQLPVVGAFKLSFATYQAAQAGVRAVAKERGFSDEEADRVAKIVGVADLVAGGKGMPAALTAAGLGGLALAGSFVPVGSLAYLAYSTARDPLATLRAAGKGLKRAIGKGDKKPERYAAEGDGRAVAIHDLLERLRRLGPAASHGYEAAVYRSLDRAPDLRRAIAAADLAYMRLRQKMGREDAPELYGWDAKDHPRGQPDNAGEFAEKGGGIKSSKSDERPGEKPPPVPMAVAAHVATDFASEASKALDSIPKHLQDALEEYGVTVQVASSVVDARPDLANVRPRGWPEGMTYANADGVYIPETKTAYVGEHYLDFETGEKTKSVRAAGSLRHELGHAIDEIYGVSQGEDFRKAHAQDVAEMPEETKLNLDYYVESGEAGWEEAFCEVFAYLHGGGARYWDPQFLEHWPRTAEVVRKALNEGGA